MRFELHGNDDFSENTNMKQVTDQFIISDLNSVNPICNVFSYNVTTQKGYTDENQIVIRIIDNIGLEKLLNLERF